jgi:DNA-binding transcriptional MerR regulator
MTNNNPDNPNEFLMNEFTIEEDEIASPSTTDEIELIAAPEFNPKIEASEDLLGDMGSIPDKMAFKIGEAADMVGVKQYVLRYWESEFDVLRPRKSKNNQRVYSRRDVETAMMIKKLLYQDRFSIEGARSALRQLKATVKEEKSSKAVLLAQDLAVSKLRGLVSEIRRARALFA